MRWRAIWPIVLALAAPARGAVQLLPGTETLVAGGPGKQTEPAIAFPYVAYADFATGVSRVYYFDANGNGGAGTRTAVGGEAGSQAFPDVAAGVIAFAQGDGAAARIMRYEIPTGLASPVASSPGPQANPCISQRVVAWEDGPAGTTAIWVEDVRQGGARAISGPGPQVKPRCSGPLVVYVDRANGRSVALFDLDTGTTVLVHPGPAESADVDQGVVALSSTAVDAGNIEVVSASGAVLAVLDLPGMQANPHVSGDWVAFEDWSTGTSRVILWNWVLGGLYAPPAVNSTQQLNDLEWPNVVYADDRNGDYDVFRYQAAFVPPPPPDGGVDGGPDGGVDGGPDGGVDGGPQPASCDDPGATVLADLFVDRGRKEPTAADTQFRVERETQVLVCIDADRVSSAWIFLDDEAIATPRDFDPHVVHLERRSEVEEGMNRLGAVVAGKPGASIRVRVLLDSRGGGDEAEEPGRGSHRDAGEGKSDGGHRDPREAVQTPTGPAGGCGTPGAGLLALLAAAWLGRRNRGASLRPR